MGQTESSQFKSEIQAITGYRFQSDSLLQQAFNHTSLRVGDSSIPTFQRLEFLGDAVLQLIVTNYLFQNYPHSSEGYLTEKRKAFVGNNKLRDIARRYNLQKFVKVADGVRAQPASQGYKGYGDYVEALLAAVYLDAGGDENENGMKSAKSVVLKLWGL